MLHQDVQSAEVAVIIVAGGQGLRMGAPIPKQFLPIRGKPLLWHTVQQFALALPLSKIIVVLPEAYLEATVAWLKDFNHHIEAVPGGATRFESVANGLRLVDLPYVFVHDGVRCLLSEDLIHRCFETVRNKGIAIPTVAISDSLRILTDEGSRPVKRDKMRAVQTPQCFKTTLLKQAFEHPYLEEFTDEATLLEKHGMQLHLVEGEKLNIKVTTAEDLQMVMALLQTP